MVIVGLTGSIGMGKTTAARMLRRIGVPVHDSDAAVHRLTGPGGAAVSAIAVAFPDTVRGGRVDRRALGARVFGDAAALRRLEEILHPMVQAETVAFLKRCARRRASVVVLDIPLLFETGRDAFCDLVAVVSAPGFIQQQRVLARPGMTRERLAAILDRQMPDAEKRRWADVVIPTGLGRAVTLRALERLIELARAVPGRHWPPVRRLAGTACARTARRKTHA